MSTLKLYSAPSCPFAQRTRLLMAEKSLDYALEEIDLTNKPDWFYRISPAGKVPCLVHDGVTLLESAVINEYLNEAFPTPDFLPGGPAHRAQARYWIARTDQRLIPAFYRLLMAQTPDLRMSQRDHFQAALAELATGYQGPYFLGKQPTLMDFALYPFFERLAMLDFYRQAALPPGAECLRDWHHTLLGRASVQALLQPTAFYIQYYSRYADGSADGVTAREMREA